MFYITVMMQWLNRWIHNPVFPGSNPGGGKVDSAFHPSEIGEMSSSTINAAQVCRGFADPPRNSFDKSSNAHSRGWY